MDPVLRGLISSEPPLLRGSLTLLASEVQRTLELEERIIACCLGIVPAEAVPVMVTATHRRLVVVGWSRDATPARNWVLTAPYGSVTDLSAPDPADGRHDPAWLVVSGYRIRITSRPDRARDVLEVVSTHYRPPMTDGDLC